MEDKSEPALEEVTNSENVKESTTSNVSESEPANVESATVKTITADDLPDSADSNTEPSSEISTEDKASEVNGSDDTKETSSLESANEDSTEASAKSPKPARHAEEDAEDGPAAKRPRTEEASENN